MNKVAVEIPNKWRRLGSELELPRYVLERIHKEYGTDTHQCFCEVFNEWAKQPSSLMPYTWATIIQALRAPQVNEKVLADRLEREYS